MQFLYYLLVITVFVRSKRWPESSSDFMPNIYYDIKTRNFFALSSIENLITNKKASQDTITNLKNNLKLEGHRPIENRPILRRIGFRSNGCSCQQETCRCCLGMNLPQFQVNREGCMNFTYYPEEFAVTMDLFMDGNIVFSNTVSAKNPPPLCIPVPIPYVPIQVETCAKLFDIYTPGQNLHMCFDFETRIERATILVLHFDCMRMGNDGVAIVKPGDTGALPPSLTSTTPSQLGSDVYDPVTEIKKTPPK